MTVRRLLIVAVVVAAVVLVVAALLVALRSVATTEERVAIIGLGGVLFAALAGGLGVGLGSWIAARATERAATVAAEEAEKDRQAALRARISDRVIAIASDALVAAERHRQDFWKQKQARDAVSVGLDRPESIPNVGPHDDLLAAVGMLYIVARQDTADAAWDVYRSLQSGLDQHVYEAGRDRQGDQVRRLTPDEHLAINAADLEYQRRKTAYLSLVRTELGLSPLEGRTPFPPEITPVIVSAVHVDDATPSGADPQPD